MPSSIILLIRFGMASALAEATRYKTPVKASDSLYFLKYLNKNLNIIA